MRKFLIDKIIKKALSENKIFEGNSRTLTQARREVNRTPSEAQKRAGNYKMGHVNILGFNISIENPKGSYRSGKSSNGKTWRTLMHNDYGYFTRTLGKDGDAIDVFIGPSLKSEKIFAVDQYYGNKFDETKVMLGFNSEAEAKKAYFSNYEKGWKGFGHITGVDVETFKKWLYDGHRQRKPFYQYKEIKNALNENYSTEEHPYYDYLSEYDEYEVFKLYQSGAKNIWFPLINPLEYQTALNEFTKYGKIEKFPSQKIYHWMGIIMKNTAILKSITAIAGHDMYFPIDEFVDVFFNDDKLKWEKWKEEHGSPDDYGAATDFLDEIGFYDDFATLPDGSSAWSDYGIRPLEKIISEYDEKLSPEQVLVLVNRCLDVTHCRGDLSSMLINGGSSVLDRVTNSQYIMEGFTKKRFEEKIMLENKIQK